MKRTKDQIRAFELAKPYIPKLQLKVAGLEDGEYGAEVLELIRQSLFSKDIEYLGRVSHQKKVELMRHSHILLQTALKEGWGLTVSEAASQGTPAIVYDSDGLRDSVRHRETGLVTSPFPETMSKRIVEIMTDHELYARLRSAAWQWSKELTFDQSYKDFKKVLELA
jgi:glycosyltransferase involved in cell wall biosynthesis